MFFPGQATEYYKPHEREGGNGHPKDMALPRVKKRDHQEPRIGAHICWNSAVDCQILARLSSRSFLYSRAITAAHSLGLLYASEAEKIYM